MTTIRSNEPIKPVVLKPGEAPRAYVRKHLANGTVWEFKQREANGPLVCDVTDPVAAAVFLSPKNANVFSAADPEALKRGGEPQGDERALSILAAIRVLAKRKADGDITNDGVPNCTTLSKEVGFTVKKDEMLALWNALDPAEFGQA